MSGMNTRALNLAIATFAILILAAFHIAGSRIAFEAGIFEAAFVLAVNKFLVID